MSMHKVAFIGSTDTFDKLILMELYNQLELSQVELSQSIEMDLAHFLPDTILIDSTIKPVEVKRLRELVRNSPILSDVRIIRLGDSKGLEDFDDLVFIDEDPDKQLLLDAIEGKVTQATRSSEDLPGESQKDPDSNIPTEDRTKIYDINQLIHTLKDGDIVEGSAPEEELEEIEEIEVIEEALPVSEEQNKAQPDQIDDIEIVSGNLSPGEESLEIVHEDSPHPFNQVTDTDVEEIQKDERIEELIKRIKALEEDRKRLDTLERELSEVKNLLAGIKELLSKF